MTSTVPSSSRTLWVLAGLLPLGLGLAGCLNEGAPNPYYLDKDNDGVIAGEDCDDNDASVYPGSVEEAEADQCMQDVDGDGYGDVDPDEGFDAGTDCDDSDETVFPGSVAEADEDECMLDADGDGYGASEPGEGYDAGTDCDDSDPDGTVWADDRDCDGVVTDEDCDDNDAGVLSADNDADCDGVPADEDCDDNDPDSLSVEDDGDCDGFLAVVDCDDNDAEVLPGTVSEVNGIEMTCLAGADFTMGSSSWEVGRDSDEEEHQVQLTTGYYVALYEVTQDLFQQYAGYRPSEYGDCGSCPVENVSWHEAAFFTNAMSSRNGMEECYHCTGSEETVNCSLADRFTSPYECNGFRLPTEAEWEHAARGGSEAAFSNGGYLSSGDEYDCSGGLVLDNGASLDDIAVYCGNDAGHPDEVGGKDPNPWGLHDVHGNVQEWCHDRYADYDGDEVDPFGAASGGSRVYRGGSLSTTPANVRVAVRGDNNATYRSDSLGFRVVRGLD